MAAVQALRRSGRFSVNVATPSASTSVRTRSASSAMRATSPAGSLLPGAFAVVADACCGSAVVTALPAGAAALTAQLRVEFIRPVPPGHAWIEGRAGTDAADADGGLARGEIVDEAGQLLA